MAMVPLLFLALGTQVVVAPKLKPLKAPNITLIESYASTTNNTTTARFTYQFASILPEDIGDVAYWTYSYRNVTDSTGLVTSDIFTELTSNIIVSDLLPGKEYDFYVTLYQGDPPPARPTSFIQSNTVASQVTFSAPTVTSSNVTANGATITKSGGAFSADGKAVRFRYYLKTAVGTNATQEVFTGVNAVTLNSGVTSFTLTGLTAATKYVIAVTAQKELLIQDTFTPFVSNTAKQIYFTTAAS